MHSQLLVFRTIQCWRRLDSGSKQNISYESHICSKLIRSQCTNTYTYTHIPSVALHSTTCSREYTYIQDSLTREIIAPAAVFSRVNCATSQGYSATSILYAFLLIQTRYSKTLRHHARQSHRFLTFMLSRQKDGTYIVLSVHLLYVRLL